MKTIKGFITFEGCEGVGKSTQVRFLKEYLEQTNQEAIFTREPGGTILAEKIRELILSDDMNPYTEAYLFAAARCDHIISKILPAIEDGKLVICDRYIDSSLAYQGFARNLGIDFVENVNSFAMNNCMPEATVFINMDPEFSWRKMKNKIVENDRMEKENTDFHNKVYQGFLNLAEKYPERYIEITPKKEKQETSDAIILSLRNRGLIK